MATKSLAPTPKSSILWTISDIWEMTKRNLLRYIRLPQFLVFSAIQPVMFVILFAFVFGGSIATPGGNYINFLIPGIIMQTVLFGSTQTGVSLAEDLSKGLIDRFRSLPMSRGAVLAGRTIADTIRTLFTVLIILAVGLLIGFRPTGGILAICGGIGLALLMMQAVSWISATIGLTVRDVETAQVASFVWVFPLTFASSAFAPVENMPAWLQAFAQISPVTVTINAIRGLMLGGPYVSDMLQSIAWAVGIMLIFIPLSISRYRRAV